MGKKINYKKLYLQELLKQPKIRFNLNSKQQIQSLEILNCNGLNFEGIKICPKK